jgi:hypothetical protein
LSFVKAFAAFAVLASDSFASSPVEQEDRSHGMEFYRAPYRVRLKETSIWDHPCRVDDVLGALSFIENKANWGVYFQGGIRFLPESDFEVITQRVFSVAAGMSEPRVPTAPSLLSQSEFALETHLESRINLTFMCSLTGLISRCKRQLQQRTRPDRFA